MEAAPKISADAAAEPSEFSMQLREAAIAAVIAGALASVMLGVRTDIAPGGLELTYRPMAVLIAAAVVFVGKLALNYLGVGLSFGLGRALKAAAPSGPAAALLGRSVGPALLLLAVAGPFLLISLYGASGARQHIDLAILILTYVMLGWGLNIVVGLAGLLDLGYVAFYAVGAYSYALLALNFGLSFWICLPLAGLFAALWGVILGFPVLRLRGDYLAIVTLAFGEIIRIVLLNWYTFTGGPDGLSRIPRPSFFGLEFDRGGDGFAATFGLDYSPIHRIVFLYFLIFGLAMLTYAISTRLRRLPIGRAWEALREDEIACRALGLNTTTTKLTAFALGAMFGGFAGSFFATRQGFISPESFTFIESAVILAIVVLGGLGSQLGVVVAAVLFIGGFEYFREFEEYRMLVFGLAMVFIMVWRPRGLISQREPSVFLKQRRAISSDLVGEGAG